MWLRGIHGTLLVFLQAQASHSMPWRCLCCQGLWPRKAVQTAEGQVDSLLADALHRALAQATAGLHLLPLARQVLLRRQGQT